MVYIIIIPEYIRHLYCPRLIITTDEPGGNKQELDN